MSKSYHLQQGFTLIELILVIGILTVLLSITLIAINPIRLFSKANNTKRRSNVNAILNAVNQFQTDNKGALPGTITTTTQTLGNGSGQLDICSNLVTKYLAAFPEDPSINNGNQILNCGSSYNSGYTASKSAVDNRIIIGAPNAENGESISASR